MLLILDNGGLLTVAATITVTVIPLTEVSDLVFAQAFVGRGVAIDIVHL